MTASAKLIAINTIGLTGAEILAAELARFPEVAMLPGQNFITHESRCYRSHQYDGWTAEKVFESLYKHQFTRSGHCWAGLTKSMSPAMLASYNREKHLAAFVAKGSGQKTTLDHFLNYIQAYRETMAGASVEPRYSGFFGCNIVLNIVAYPDFFQRAVVIDFTNPLDYWLANIGQRMVWDNMQAIRFWLVNMLAVKRWALEHPNHFARVDIREYVRNREGVAARLQKFLGLDSASGAEVPDGFIRFSGELVGRIEKSSADMCSIYGGWAEFDLGMNFDDWAGDFVMQPGIPELLDKYVKFWDSSSHTNLDWVGPLEEEIVERLVDFNGAKNKRNLNRWFYHDCFLLCSDDWAKTSGKLEHYLGCLEEEIVLPEMAYYARVALCYFERVADNTVKRAYSAVPIRQTNLYRRVTDEAYRKNFDRWALEEKLAEVERRIDEAEQAIAKFC